LKAKQLYSSQENEEEQVAYQHPKQKQNRLNHSELPLKEKKYF